MCHRCNVYKLFCKAWVPDDKSLKVNYEHNPKFCGEGVVLVWVPTGYSDLIH